MVNIYLDIDGMLLANDKNKANYADEFIKHIVTNILLIGTPPIVGRVKTILNNYWVDSFLKRQ